MRNTRDKFPGICSGRIKVYAANDPEYVLLDQRNMICNSSRGLIARILATGALGTSNTEPLYGVWGLSLGAGSSDWANSSPSTPPPLPDPNNRPTSLINEVVRKPLRPGGVHFLNEDDSPASDTTTWVEFQTLINATTDGIVVPLMEMGLVGGGTRSANNGSGTLMATAPFWDPAHNDLDSVVLLNYTTFGSLALPAGLDFVFAWTLEF